MQIAGLPARNSTCQSISRMVLAINGLGRDCLVELVEQGSIDTFQLVDAAGLLLDDDARRSHVDAAAALRFDGNMFHRPVGDVVKVTSHHERMLIPVDELRDDLAVAHVAVAGYGFDGQRFPTIHAPLDALVSDEIRRKSRFPEDFGWRFARQVADGAHLFERIGVGDAIARYVGDRRQSAQ